MKHLLSFLLIISSLFCYPQSDEKINEHSIGGFIAPAEFVLWPRIEYSELISSGPKRMYATPGKPFGAYYQYQINRFLKVFAAVSSTTERFVYKEVTGTPKQEIDLNYKVSYLKVPVGIRFFPYNIEEDDDIEGGFFIEGGISLDFVIKEDIKKEVWQYYDKRFGPPPGGYPQKPLSIIETHSGQKKFHRICPYIFMGKEVAFNDLSLFFGGRFEFQAIYQNHNVQEYIRNVKFSPNIGFGYRF